jgi:hypothetical protein
MNIIQKNISDYLSNDDNTLTKSGARFTVLDFKDLIKIINNTEEDFLIFDNSESKKFDIIFDRPYIDDNEKSCIYKVKDTIKSFLKNTKSWIYCYQIDGKQTIIRNIK